MTPIPSLGSGDANTYDHHACSAYGAQIQDPTLLLISTFASPFTAEFTRCSSQQQISTNYTIRSQARLLHPSLHLLRRTSSFRLAHNPTLIYHLLITWDLSTTDPHIIRSLIAHSRDLL
ncbi:hypothetical protein FRC12_000561 [Ceratobasidium sp. 428]|nr:hypothetical protein FRC12_000561 [Ceratobasidium sp. 428]